MTSFIDTVGLSTPAPAGGALINKLLYNNLSNWGATGNGTTDDTAAINAAATGCNGTLVVGTGTYYITSLVTFPNVTLIIAPDALFTGTGSIRGVINNDTIPHAAFQVPYNLVTQRDRNPNVTAGSYYVDPLLGYDAAAGTSVAPFATIAQALMQIASVAATFNSNMTIVLRGGRHEVTTGGITMNSSHTLTGGYSVTWISNAAERAYITAPTKWFFTSSPAAATYQNFVGVTNPLGYDFQDLWDAETGLPVDCTNNMGPNYSLLRNQTTNVTVSGTTNNYKISLTITAIDTTNFSALTATEQAGVRLRITNWYTTSWINGLSLSGSVLTGNCSNALQANGQGHYNGWAYINIDDPFGAPYLLMNLKNQLNGDNFAAYSDHVWLPNRGTNYFTVDNSTLFLINTGNAQKHYFEGIYFRYQAAGMTTLTKIITNASASYQCAGTFNWGLLIGQVGVSGASNCDFSYTNLNGVQTCGGTSAGGGGGTYYNNTMTHIGICGFIAYQVANGSDNVSIINNVISRWGHFTTMFASGILCGGVNVNVSYNELRNGTCPAIRIDSNATLTTGGNGTPNVGAATGPFGGMIQYNVALDCGYIDQAPADLYLSNDVGVIYTYVPGAISAGYQVTSYTVDSNVFGRSYGYRARCIMCDSNATQNLTITNNLCWGGEEHGMFMNGGTGGSSTVYGNTINNNIILGSVVIAASTAGGATNTSFNYNAVAASNSNSVPVPSGQSETQTGIITITGTNYGFKCDPNQYIPVIDRNDWQNFFNSANYALSPFVRSFLQFKNFVNPGPAYRGGQEANYGYVIVPGTTYTVQDQDADILCTDTATMTITLPDYITQPGRKITIRTSGAYAVNASASVVQHNAATNAVICPATAGAWVQLTSSGSAWVVTMSGTIS